MNATTFLDLFFRPTSLVTSAVLAALATTGSTSAGTQPAGWQRQLVPGAQRTTLAETPANPTVMIP